MRGLWLEKQAITYREDLPRPQLSEGYALIKTRLAGICSTDLELLRGYYPFKGVIGHEFVGQVVETPQETDLVGQRVVGEINLGCGSCKFCQSGVPAHCLNRKALGIHGQDGVFADYFLLPVENLHPVPAAVPDEKAVFVEPLAAVLRLVDQVHIRPGDRVLVIGAGRLGQLAAQVLRLTGADLDVVVRHPVQEKILSQFGIRTLAEEAVPEGEYHVVVDATGAPSGFQAARKAVRPMGTLLLKSTYAGELTVDASSLVVDEISVIGSRCGPFAPAIRLLKKGLVDPEPLIAGRFSITAWKAAFHQVQQPGILKILLEMPER